MNQLNQFQKTMSSLEIAELTGKEHKHVRRDIENMLTKLPLNQSSFGRTYIDSRNRAQEVYELPKRESLILVSGYSVELRAKIIDRWDELENAENKTKSLEELSLEVITGLSAKIQEQKLALEQAQPKIEFHDVVTNSEKCFSMTETVKLLNLTIGRNKFYVLLKAEKILKDDREPYQQYIDQGYFRVVLKQVGHGGVEKVTLVTGKGLAWLQKKYTHVRLREVI